MGGFDGEAEIGSFGSTDRAVEGLAHLAAVLFAAPWVIIRGGGGRQWSVGPAGADAAPVVAFCEAAGDGVYEDARAHAALAAHPAVAGAPGVRFYAGVPFGPPATGAMLCLLDTRPRLLSEEDRRRLAVLVDQLATAEALAEAEERFRLAFASTLLGMAIVDDAGRWVEVNGALSQMLGAEPDALVGTMVLDRVHPDDRSVALDVLAGSTPRDDIRFVHAEDFIVWAQLTCARARGEGQHRFSICQLDDVTARRAINETLESYAEELAMANRELARANAFKDQLVATVSHELRTPLTSIVGFAQLMARPDEPPEARGQWLAVIERQAHRLNTLVEDLLTRSAVDAGTVRVEPEVVDVAAAVKLALESSGVGSMPVNVDCPDGLSVLADPHRLEQILVNLLANARRYGEPPVTIVSRLADGTVSLEVRDEGPGVAEDVVPELFKPYATGKAGVGSPGNGLGLAISRRLAELMGGSLTYVPPGPTGACFELKLPPAS